MIRRLAQFGRSDRGDRGAPRGTRVTALPGDAPTSWRVVEAAEPTGAVLPVLWAQAQPPPAAPILHRGEGVPALAALIPVVRSIRAAVAWEVREGSVGCSLVWTTFAVTNENKHREGRPEMTRAPIRSVGRTTLRAERCQRRAPPAGHRSPYAPLRSWS